MPIRAVLNEKDGGLDYYAFTLSSEKSGTFFQVDEGGTGTHYNFTLTGEDADLFKFGYELGVLQTVDNPSSGIPELNPLSKILLDYENPTDTGGDNIYNFDISFISEDQHAINDNNHKAKMIFTLTITDADDGPTTVTPASGPVFTREGDIIKLSVDEGDKLIYDMDDVTLSQTGLSGVLPDVLKGTDANAVQVSVMVSKSNVYDLRLEFVSDPDTAAPADNDQDNVYEFEFAGILADVLPFEFEVTALDVA